MGNLSLPTLNCSKSRKNIRSFLLFLRKEAGEIQIVTEKLEGFDGKAIIPNIEHAYVYFMDYLLKDKMEMYSEKSVETYLINNVLMF